ILRLDRMLLGSLSALAPIGLLSTGVTFGSVAGLPGGFTSPLTGLRSSTAAPGSSLASWLAHPARTASAIMLNISFLIAAAPFLLAFQNRTPCGLAHISNFRAEALPHAAIAGYRC